VENVIKETKPEKRVNFISVIIKILAIAHLFVAGYIIRQDIINFYDLFEKYENTLFAFFAIDFIVVILNICACVGLLFGKPFGIWFSLIFLFYEFVESIGTSIFIANIELKTMFEFNIAEYIENLTYGGFFRYIAISAASTLAIVILLGKKTLDRFKVKYENRISFGGWFLVFGTAINILYLIAEIYSN